MAVMPLGLGMEMASTPGHAREPTLPVREGARARASGHGGLLVGERACASSFGFVLSTDQRLIRMRSAIYSTHDRAASTTFL